MARDLNTGLRFGFLIHDVSRLRRVVVDRALRPLGITRSQWWVLAFLSRRDGMTQTALAADLDLTKVAIGGLLDRMEAAGFVEPQVERVEFTRRYASLDAWWLTQTQMSVDFASAEEKLDFAARSDILAELEEAAKPFTQADDSLVVPAATWVAAATA